MKSLLKLPYNLNDETKAIVLADIVNPMAGSDLYVYIPRLMQLIPNPGSFEEPPEPEMVHIGGCFKGGSNTATVSEVVQARNYFTGYFQLNSTGEHTVVKQDDGEEEVHHTTMPSGTQIRSMFKNGKLDKLVLTTDIIVSDNDTYADDEQTYFTYFHYKTESGYGGDYEPSRYDQKNPGKEINSGGPSQTYTKDTKSHSPKSNKNNQNTSSMRNRRELY